MNGGGQTANVTIISYKPLSDLNFARCLLHALFSIGVYKPLVVPIVMDHALLHHTVRCLSSIHSQTGSWHVIINLVTNSNLLNLVSSVHQ